MQVCLKLIQKKNQIRCDPDLVICTEQQNYSAFHLPLLQNIRSCKRQMSITLKGSEVL